MFHLPSHKFVDVNQNQTPKTATVDRMSQSKLSKEQMDSLRVVFTALDNDGSGQVSAAELLPALQTIQASATMDDAQALMKEVDIDSSCAISFDEFISVMEKKLAETTTEEHMFEIINTSGTGFLTPSELSNALARVGMEQSEQILDDMIRAVDKDGDGMISHEEFKTALA